MCQLFWLDAYSQSPRPDFSGTWELSSIQKGHKPKKYKEIRIIDHRDPTVGVTIRESFDKKEVVRSQIFFTDERGEKNFFGRDDDIVESKTRWKRKAILILRDFSVPVNGDENNRARMRHTTIWKLSKNQKKMIESVSVSYFGSIKMLVRRRVYKRTD